MAMESSAILIRMPRGLPRGGFTVVRLRRLCIEFSASRDGGCLRGDIMKRLKALGLRPKVISVGYSVCREPYASWPAKAFWRRRLCLAPQK
jgi:hypothetical protein